MKQALLYIAIIVGVYLIIDVILYFIANAKVRALLGMGRKAPKRGETPELLDELAGFLEKVREWMEKDQKLEYKSVWVGNRLADGLMARVKFLEKSEQAPKTDNENEPPEKPPEGPVERDGDEKENTPPADTKEGALKTIDLLNGFGPKYVWTLIKAFGIAVILALFIRTFIVQAFKIPSGSMIPTLYVGDQLLVSKFKYGVRIPFTDEKLFKLWEPKRGDVVVFRPPGSVSSSWQNHEIRVPGSGKVIYKWRSQVDFIKRIVGLPGDKVELKDGVLYVNDVEMPMKELGEQEYKKKTGNYVRSVGALLFEENLDGQEHLVIHNDLDLEDMKSEDEGPFYVGPGEFFAMGDNRDDSQDSRRWGGASAKLKDIRGKAFIIHFSWDPVDNKPRLDRVGKLIR